MELHGRGIYKLEYVGDIDHVRLWSGNTLAYEGPPVASLETAGGPLAIELRLKGEGSISVSDTCSVGSIFSGLADMVGTFADSR